MWSDLHGYWNNARPLLLLVLYLCVFTGERDIRKIDGWISAIERCKAFCGWDDERTFIYALTLIEGCAEIWLRLLEKDHPDMAPIDWTTLKALVIDQFTPTNAEDNARDTLDNIKQASSVRGYVNEFMDITPMIPNMFERKKNVVS